MKIKYTSRGFEIIYFKDGHEAICTLQQSSAINTNSKRRNKKPGSSFIWLGYWKDRMYLSRKKVLSLIYHLLKWFITGRF